MSGVGSRFLIETDVLVASLDRAIPAMKRQGISSSTLKILLYHYAHSLIEFDLLIRSGDIKVKDYVASWRKLGEMLNYYRTAIVKPSPPTLPKQAESGVSMVLHTSMVCTVL